MAVADMAPALFYITVNAVKDPVHGANATHVLALIEQLGIHLIR
jgi:hypothetical protein